MSNELAHPAHPNTRTTKIRRIGVISMATTQAVLMMALSLVVVLIYAVIGGSVLAIGAAAGSSSTGAGGPSPAQLAGMGVGMIIAMVIFVPMIYGAMGFIFGALGALIYNVVAGWTGGVEMELLDREDARPH